MKMNEDNEKLLDEADKLIKELEEDLSEAEEQKESLRLILDIIGL